MGAFNEAYAQPSDLAKYGTNKKFLSDVPNDEQVAACEAASGLANSYLTAQFTLPLKAWGQDLVRAVCIIAVYDLVTKRGYNPEARSDVSLRERYLDVIKWLESISKGDVTPTVIDSSDVDGLPFALSSSQRGFSVRGTGRTPGPFEGD